MDINALLDFSHIAIQCHDTPDADAIAAGFGLYCFFRARGKDVTLFYGGDKPVAKPNLIKMVSLFHIPLLHVPVCRNWPGLLITVDCQFGAGNVSSMTAREIAVIDHHIPELPPPLRHNIQPHLGSCSTLVWNLLLRAGFDAVAELGEADAVMLQTALYYGLFMDTGGLAEVRHPLDRDLRDNPHIDERTIKILKSSYLSLDDLALAARALEKLQFVKKSGLALVAVEPCDSNLLGYISDLVMQVDSVEVALVFSAVSGGIKYSVRTVMREAKASDIAAWLAEDGLGSGGGHSEKAGGWISMQNLSSLCPDVTAESYFRARMDKYWNRYDILDTHLPIFARPNLPYSQAVLFRKKTQCLAYIPCSALPFSASRLSVRMLEDDIDLETSQDTYLMLGLRGEVYPIERALFERLYRPLEKGFTGPFPHPPTILDRETGERITLNPLAKSCESRGGGRVFALCLQKGLKLFTRWDRENYAKGEAGDWLLWPEQDPDDMYIVTDKIFPHLYEADTSPMAVDRRIPGTKS